MILTVTLNPAIDKIYFVENYQLGEVHRPTKTIASPGGKGLNVARVANLLGKTVGATGFLGGPNGSFIDSEVKKLGIKSEFLRIEGETRICINVSDVEKGTSTEVLEAGPVISSKEQKEFLNMFEKLVAKYDIIAFSGSLAQGVATDYYKKLIEIVKKAGKKALLDTSGKAFIEGIEAAPYVIKPNADEIKAFYEAPVTTLEEAKTAILYFKEKGIELPIISMGKDGCVAGLADGVYHFQNPKVKVINTVGSGDSFIGGCAVGLDRGYSLEDTLKLAIACGTANTQFEQTGFVTKELVDQYFKEVIVKKID